jgi:hypothetical protein
MFGIGVESILDRFLKSSKQADAIEVRQPARAFNFQRAWFDYLRADHKRLGWFDVPDVVEHHMLS